MLIIFLILISSIGQEMTRLIDSIRTHTKK